MKLKTLLKEKLVTIIFIGFMLILAFIVLFSLPFIFTHAQDLQESQATSTIFFTKTLRIKVTDDQVKYLQEILGGLVVDGNFGQKTKLAVMLFQKEKGIFADGIVGPITRAQLNELAVTKATNSFNVTSTTNTSIFRTINENTFIGVTTNSNIDTGLPFRLRIPKINVDDPFESVGLTPDGAMDVPKGPRGVAWFSLGPRPGEIGSAVISGHYGWKDNIQAVFDNLYKLKKGDKIYVEDEKGVTTTFIVRELRYYDRNAEAGDVFYSTDGRVHLNLITCGGAWNATEKTHSQRLVVFTDKE
jgi:LPXTG-site transpeptidase (sortase) family protein